MGNSEENYRHSVFNMNAVKAAKMNENSEAIFGMTQFADLTEHEFSTTFKGYLGRKQKFQTEFTPFVGDVPATKDWRNENRVGPVLNQGQCGSCWAFSTVGSVEQAYAEVQGTVKQFSEQQLVDCSKEDGDAGCNGGLMDGGLAYVQKHGLESLGDYSYTGQDGSCKEDTTKDDTTVANGKVTDMTTEDQLLNWVGMKGPASVGVVASMFWQLYFGGVLSNWECMGQVDHGVLAVGYTEDAWIVKNSWGASWGEKGYIRLKRGSNTCKLASQASGYSLKN